MSTFIVSKIFSLYLMATLINRPAARPNDREAQFLFRDKRDVQVCYTEECIELDEMLVATMERQIDPCENFYEYVCKHYNSSKSAATEPFRAIAAKAGEILKESIGVDDSSALVMAKEMYQTCVNHTSEMGELKKLVYSLGGWDYSEEPGKEFSLEKFYTKAAAQGYVPRSLFTVDMYRDTSPANYGTKIEIKEAGMRLKMMDTVEWMFSNYGVNHSSFFFPMLLEKLQIYPIEGEKAIKGYEAVREVVLKSNQLPREPQKAKVSQLNLLYPNIPWNAILSAIFQPLVIKDDEKVSVLCPECLSMVNDLVGSTSKRTLSTYLLWSMVTAVAYSLDNELLDDYLKFTKAGKRPDYCAAKTIEQFRRIIDYEYIKRYFNNCSRCDAITYVQRLQNSLEILINEDETIDNVTKKVFHEKANKMRFKIAIDDAIKTEQSVKEYYAGLALAPERSYFRALLALSKFLNEKNAYTLRGPPVEPYLKATGNQAQNFRSLNTVYLCASLVEDVMFPEKSPQHDNFGSFGSLVGHEMTHSFDSHSLFINATGTFDNETSWTQSTIDERLKKFECIKKQYSEYINPETGHKIDGVQTLHENIADNGGTQLAYHAYDLWLRSNEEQDLSLRHFKEFTPRQMFWVSLARRRCGTLSKFNMANFERYSDHSPNRFRVNGVVSNSEAFAKDWNCKSGSRMNPRQKCRVWGA